MFATLTAAEAKIFSQGEGRLVNPSGVHLQREDIPAATWITKENFQNLFGNLRKSWENIMFPKKSSTALLVYLGFRFQPHKGFLRNQHSYYLRRSKTLFLLLMDANLAEVLQTPVIPPGFEPSPSVVAPEVFEQMRIYMNCADPEERRIRESRMIMTLQDLSKDPIGQRSCLRLERAPVLSKEVNTDRGRVFDFSRVQSEVAPDISELSSRGPLRQKIATDKRGACGEVEKGLSEGFGEDHREEGLLTIRNQQMSRRGEGYLVNQGDGVRMEGADIGGFAIGSGRNISSERQARSRNSQSSRSSWARRSQSKRKSVPTEIAEVIRRGWCNNFASRQGSVSEHIQSCRRELSKWKRSANMGEIAVRYFEDLFHSSGIADSTELLEGLTPRISERMNRVWSLAPFAQSIDIRGMVDLASGWHDLFALDCLPLQSIKRPTLKPTPPPREPTPPNTTTLNSDAAWLADWKLAGLGWTIRENNTTTKRMSHCCFVSFPLVAEALALREAMANCVNRGTQNLHCQFDSLVLVTALKSGSPISKYIYNSLRKLYIMCLYHVTYISGSKGNELQAVEMICFAFKQKESQIEVNEIDLHSQSRKT
ncbi:hypothetical protein HID58_075485 [Brassica napus]|uniref:RNase H type-1 domain-containing protein n=1 Tax=Brassica napus TaxID=3708 RepID=A0ABQ7YK25_BRANA|nr:hypothetical protein HID58_075485 [Brassica napus]